jgi:hypothetical protein
MFKKFLLMNIILLCLCGFLLYKLISLWFKKPEVVSAQTIVPGKESFEPERVVIKRPSKFSYNDIVDKNLFHPDRSPIKQETEQANDQQVTQITIPFNLQGTTIMDNGERFALIFDPRNRTVVRYYQGDNIDTEYKIEEILENKITLSKANETYTLEIFKLKDESGNGTSSNERSFKRPDFRKRRLPGSTKN